LRKIFKELRVATPLTRWREILFPDLFPPAAVAPAGEKDYEKELEHALSPREFHKTK